MQLFTNYFPNISLHSKAIIHLRIAIITLTGIFEENSCEKKRSKNTLKRIARHSIWYREAWSTGLQLMSNSYLCCLPPFCFLWTSSLNKRSLNLQICFLWNACDYNLGILKHYKWFSTILRTTMNHFFSEFFSNLPSIVNIAHSTDNIFSRFPHSQLIFSVEK